MHRRPSVLLLGGPLWLGLALFSSSVRAAPLWNCYFQSALTDPTYQDAVVARVHKHWRATQPRPGRGKKTVVRAVLGKDGALRSTGLHLSSSSKAWDDAVLAAIQHAAPYPPLPKGYAYETLEFDCHVSP